MEDKIFFCNGVLEFPKKWEKATNKDVNKYQKNIEELRDSFDKNYKHKSGYLVKKARLEYDTQIKRCNKCNKDLMRIVWNTHQVVNHLNDGLLDFEEHKNWRNISECGKQGIIPPELNIHKGKYIIGFNDEYYKIQFS